MIEEVVKEHPQLPAYAVTVGKKPTAAAAYIDDPGAVLELLHSLSKYSEKDKRYFSAMDLPSQATNNNGGGALGGLGESVRPSLVHSRPFHILNDCGGLSWMLTLFYVL